MEPVLFSWLCSATLGSHAASLGTCSLRSGQGPSVGLLLKIGRHMIGSDRRHGSWRQDVGVVSRGDRPQGGGAQGRYAIAERTGISPATPRVGIQRLLA
jgi:hypothetical protein